ncbi:MAG TPA: DUF368 domain-containing protein [Clostridiales bacterium]|nr:DUF368 domain-containing protein [Clostridiales bacterium]HOL78760.1 DUF368 domain-containing protein [Clostridiales bacterium]HPP67494.1 DUF368 domain-containing protein [Clostridiales bacterium]HPU67034.1 DUF368 domain-containing protein [Clostridiales bacterium]HQA05696.1 DUF368 domain-containing protein [Clostridiales bacterium]
MSTKTDSITHKENNAEFKPFKGFFKRLIFAFIIGVAFITPGLSGGVIAAAAGIYEPSVNAIVTIHKNFRKSFFYLLPIGIGAVSGVLIFSRILEQIIQSYETTLIFIFLGLVIGSIPAFIKEANSEGFKKIYAIPTVLTFALVMVIEKILSQPAFHNAAAELTLPMFIVCGIIMSLGIIIPGISSSFILMAMGIYNGLLSTINSWVDNVFSFIKGGFKGFGAFLASFDWASIFALGLSFAITSIIAIKLVDILFKRYHGVAYYSVFGFLLGSMVAAFPGFRGGIGTAIDIAAMAAAVAIGYFGMKLNGKVKD